MHHAFHYFPKVCLFCNLRVQYETKILRFESTCLENIYQQDWHYRCNAYVEL